MSKPETGLIRPPTGLHEYGRAVAAAVAIATAIAIAVAIVVVAASSPSYIFVVP